MYLNYVRNPIPVTTLNPLSYLYRSQATYSLTYTIKSNVNKIVVRNSTPSPHRKITSAVRSQISDLWDLLRMDRKEKRHADMKRIIATRAISSIIVCSPFPSTLNDVSTKQQIPSRFAEVLKMCGDFSGCSPFMITKVRQNELSKMKYRC